ncbi:MAG: hypothetical protein AABX32_00785 [Nanoarchaeota archaeon]
MCGTCHDGVCSKCMGGKLIVVGAIVIANQYWSIVGWWYLLGALLVLKGVVKLAMPGGCGHCATEVKKGKK